jgi:hypothetical protein
MDSLTLFMLLLGFGSTTTSDTDDPGSGDPGRGGVPIGG